MKRAAPLDVEAVAEALAEHVKALVTRETAVLLARIAALEAREPVHGKDGKDGVDGKDGLNGADGKDGTSGENGTDGHHGKDGTDGKDGHDGKEGRGIIDAIPGEDGTLTLIFTDGTTKNVGRIRGRDGTDGVSIKGDPGEKGKDGLGWDDLEIVPNEEEQSVIFRLRRGDDVKESPPLVYGLRYREIFKAGETYRRSDVVTYDGSGWYCRKSGTDERPGVGQDWRLMVKHGRDGKAGAAGVKGDPGQVVRAPAPYVPFSNGPKS